MFTPRGDAHKFYLKLKKTVRSGHPVHQLKEIIEVNDIKQFYNQMNGDQLSNIRYRMLKEKDGNGMIPLLVTALPWLGFLVSNQLQSFLTKGIHILFVFLIAYMLVMTTSVILHYREKAWATVHIEIIEDILKEREKRTDDDDF